MKAFTPLAVLSCIAGLQAGVLEDRLARIPQRMQEFVDKGAVFGVVTLVQHQGKPVSLKAVGFQDAEKKQPMAADSIFQVMSMTKPVTSVGILILAEEGRLSLTDTVEKDIPEFRGQMLVAEKQPDGRLILKKPARPITLRDLLTHTSGMQEFPPDGMGGLDFYRKMDKPLSEAVSVYSQLPLLFEPGSRVQYSNPGMATLGRIIEVVSGMPYEKFLDARIFQPLGMKDSFFFPPAEKRGRVCHVHVPGQSQFQEIARRPYREGARYSFPEGGLYSTAADMAAFYQMMRNGGAYNGKRILSPAAVKAMTEAHNEAVQPAGTVFGLGWAVVNGPRGTLTLHSEGSFGHGGAFGTYGWIDPAKDLVGVFMIQVLGGQAGAIQQVFVSMANAAITD